MKKLCVSSSAIPSWWFMQPSRVTLILNVKIPAVSPVRDTRSHSREPARAPTGKLLTRPGRKPLGSGLDLWHDKVRSQQLGEVAEGFSPRAPNRRDLAKAWHLRVRPAHSASAPPGRPSVVLLTQPPAGASNVAAPLRTPRRHNGKGCHFRACSCA